MKKVYLINFYKEKKEKKIKKYDEFLKVILNRNLKLLIINEGEEIKDPEGIILSGSQKMVGDGEMDLDYLKYLFSFRKPTLGICYGHQALSKFFGAEVKRAKKEHKGFEELILIKKNRIFEGFPSVFEMYESHFEEVLKTEVFLKNFEIIAENKEGGIETVAHKKIPFFGVQFHPEESREYGKIFFRNFFNLI